MKGRQTSCCLRFVMYDTRVSPLDACYVWVRPTFFGYYGIPIHLGATMESPYIRSYRRANIITHSV